MKTRILPVAGLSVCLGLFFSAGRARAGGSGSAAGYGATAHPNGSSVITGWFTGSAVFGEGEAAETTLSAGGTADVFVAGYSGSGEIGRV